METRKFFLLLQLSFLLFSGWACSKDEAAQEPIAYEGPLLEADSIRILYSDSAIVKIVVEAPKQYEFESGDREFPEGILVQFFETDGSMSSTLRADHGYFFSEESRYTGVGNVLVENIKESNKLITDTLHWSQREEKVYTKAKVTIIEGLDTLRGQGLEAAQDFSTYTILQPEGSRVLSESSEEETEETPDEVN